MHGATAANMETPNAQVCSAWATLIGISGTSAKVCILNGDFDEIPLISIMLSILISFSRKRPTSSVPIFGMSHPACVQFVCVQVCDVFYYREK